MPADGLLDVQRGAAVEPPVELGTLLDIGAIGRPQVLDNCGALIERDASRVVDQEWEEQPPACRPHLGLEDRCGGVGALYAHRLTWTRSHVGLKVEDAERLAHAPAPWARLILIQRELRPWCWPCASSRRGSVPEADSRGCARGERCRAGGVSRHPPGLSRASWAASRSTANTARQRGRSAAGWGKASTNSWLTASRSSLVPHTHRQSLLLRLKATRPGDGSFMSFAQLSLRLCIRRSGML